MLPRAGAVSHSMPRGTLDPGGSLGCMPRDRDDGTLAEGMTRNDECAGCGSPQFWGVVHHYDGCPTPDVMAHPAALARRDQLLAGFRDLYDL